MRALTLLALATGVLCAQALQNLEVRGRVIEPGLDVGVAGAEVIFSVVENATRNPLARTFTDSSGSFRFQAPRPGNYFVESHKDGYQGGSLSGLWEIGNEISRALYIESPVKLTGQRPVPELHFTMVRPGEITGRIVDENREPIAGLRVTIHQRTQAPSFAALTATTAEDGSFTASNVPPGDLVVSVAGQSGNRMSVRTTFSPEDAALVSQEMEASSTPARVSSGATVSVGTIVTRKASYYRARVSVPGGCAPGEQWNFDALAQATTALLGDVHSVGFPCAREFLIEKLKPGSYLFVLWQGQSGSPSKWAQAPVEIVSRNPDVALTLTPGADVSGRIVAASGARLPPLDKMMVMAPTDSTALMVTSGASMGRVDTEGKFVIPKLLWPRHQFRVVGLPQTHYVKEVHYSGGAAEQGFFNLTSGAQIEIVIDDKVATVTGSLSAADKPVAQGVLRAIPWPMVSPQPFGDMQYVAKILNGRFELAGLPPGDYRIFAVSVADGSRTVQDLTVLNQFASRVETTRLGPSETRTLTLRLLE